LIYGYEIKTWCVPKWVAKIGAWLQAHLPFFPTPFIKPWMIDLADDHYELDVSLAEKLLGWKPQHSLEEVLPKIIQELKDNPEHWYKMNQLKYRK
jgi:nucleoside-diphosphate-sugar epimerase